ncbi:uncharacterized protein LOC144140817 [Haemaphysalis longicornis]
MVQEARATAVNVDGLRSCSGPHLSTLELRSRTLPSTMSHGNHHESTPPVAPIICPGTVRQRDPPFFNGTDDQDAEDWLATFERVSTHNNWHDKHKQNNVSLSFTGVAETWYKNHGSDLRTWSDFKTEFTKVFGRPALRKLRAEQHLRERPQRTNESFTSYIEDILDLCKRANNDMTEEGKIKHILKGIDDDAFQMLLAKNPRTVAELINACQEFDELRGERALTRKPALLGGGLDAAPWELPTAGVFLHGGRVGAGSAVVCVIAWRHFDAGPHFALARLLDLLILPRCVRADNSSCMDVIYKRSRYTCSGWLQHYASRRRPAVFG